jgi:hypothetical protein
MRMTRPLLKDSSVSVPGNTSQRKGRNRVVTERPWAPGVSRCSSSSSQARPLAAGPLASGSLAIRVFSFDLGLVASQIPGQALSAPASGLAARGQARCWQVPGDWRWGSRAGSPWKPGCQARGVEKPFPRRRRSSPSGRMRMRLCTADGRPRERKAGRSSAH